MFKEIISTSLLKNNPNFYIFFLWYVNYGSSLPHDHHVSSPASYDQVIPADEEEGAGNLQAH